MQSIATTPTKSLWLYSLSMACLCKHSLYLFTTLPMNNLHFQWKILKEVLTSTMVKLLLRVLAILLFFSFAWASSYNPNDSIEPHWTMEGLHSTYVEMSSHFDHPLSLKYQRASREWNSYCRLFKFYNWPLDCYKSVIFTYWLEN